MLKFVNYCIKVQYLIYMYNTYVVRKFFLQKKKKNLMSKENIDLFFKCTDM